MTHPRPRSSNPHAAAPPLPWRAGLLASLLVAVVVSAAFWPVLATRAISMDDGDYVSNNALVTRPGVASTVQFFREAMHPTTVGGYWMPLSMTSLMLDVAQGGSETNPAPFHRTSLALHVLASVALFWLLLLLFGAPVPAALAAMAFGLHPLAVEPVAWIGERKTVLAGALALGAAALHVAWVRRGGAGWRAAAVVAFALALLAKPTATPLPVMLLLLDAWPLRRMGRAAVVEKWPFALVAAASACVTLLSHAHTGTLEAGGSFATLPLEAATRLAFYVGKTLAPVRLACVYAGLGPFAWTRPASLAALAAVLAAAALVIAQARRRPALLACAGWYVLALAPVLGLLRYSWVSVSDKYVYLALAGVALALAGLLARAWRAAGAARAATVVAALAVLGAEAAGSRAAIAHWRDSLTLWRHIVDVSPREAGAHNGLAGALLREHRHAEALAEFERATACDSTFWMAWGNVSYVALILGDQPKAERAVARALAIMPNEVFTLHQAALVAKGAGRWAEAERLLRQYLGVHPFDAPARTTLAEMLDRQGRRDEALAELRQAVVLQPGLADAEFGLARVLVERDGFTAEARAHYEAALRGRPEWTQAMNELAWGLATSPDAALRNGARAVELATRASALAGDTLAEILDTRAAAEAEAGDFERAVATERAALARAAGASAAGLAERLARFQNHQPWREGSGAQIVGGASGGR